MFADKNIVIILRYKSVEKIKWKGFVKNVSNEVIEITYKTI